MSGIQVVETKEVVNGDTKIVTELLLNADKSKTLVTTESKLIKKTIKVNKFVQERRKLAKFGDCKNSPPGPEPSISSYMRDVIEIRCLPPREPQEEIFIEKTEVEKIAEGKGVNVCPRCGEEGHIFLTCPKRVNVEKLASSTTQREKFASKDISIRISNLSEDVSEETLDHLIKVTAQNYGFPPPLRGVSFPKSTDPRPRTFAFVNYNDEEAAQKFVEALDSHKYDSRVLQVEIIRNRGHKYDLESRGEDKSDNRFYADSRASKFDDFKISNKIR